MGLHFACLVLIKSSNLSIVDDGSHKKCAFCKKLDTELAIVQAAGAGFGAGVLAAGASSNLARAGSSAAVGVPYSSIPAPPLQPPLMRPPLINLDELMQQMLAQSIGATSSSAAAAAASIPTTPSKKSSKGMCAFWNVLHPELFVLIHIAHAFFFILFLAFVEEAPDRSEVD